MHMCFMMMGLLGAGVSAMGAIAQGDAKAKADRIQAQQDRLNAQLQQRQAVADQVAGQAKQRAMVEKGAALAGQQIAAVGGSGLALSGSPTDVVLDSTRERALDVANVKYNTDLQTSNTMYQARISAYNADNADKAASTDEQAGMLGALSAGIGGISKMFGGGSGGGLDMTSLGAGF